MIQIAVATLMWILVASLLVLRRGRREHSIIYASVAIALAMTLNIDAVYVPMDALLGAVNRATLLADAALMIGLFFLGRGIMKAVAYQPGPVRAAMAVLTLFVALCFLMGAFWLIARGTTTTEFMLELGDQPAAAIYSMINFAYCGIVVAAMGALAWRQFRASDGGLRLPILQVVIGAACGVLLTIVVLIMDIAHLAGALDLMSLASAAYGPLHFVTFVFLCSGLAGQPLVRAAQERVRQRRTAELMERLEPTWSRASRLRPGLSRVGPSEVDVADAETRLHRAIVEIRDAMIDSRIDFRVDDAERTALENTEQHLLGPISMRTSSPGAHAPADHGNAGEP